MLHELQHQVSSVFDLIRGETASSPARERDAKSAARGESIATRLRQAAAAVSAGVGASPPTPLNVEIGPNRRFEWLRTRFDHLGAIRAASGATLNDVVLAIVTGAVRAFLQHRGCSVRELDFRVMVPVSVRTTDERGKLGNRVSQLVVHIPLEAEEPLERLRLLSEQTSELKRSGQAEGGRLLTGLSELLLPSLAGAIERIAVRHSFGNMIVTNVPGARFTAYMLGSRLLEAYPLVPLSAKQALNIAVLSYEEHLHWGINADYDAIPDASDFAALLSAEAEALYKAATAREAQSPGPRT
jgi:WS/DGAT/MGAT family acyltransferase